MLYNHCQNNMKKNTEICYKTCPLFRTPSSGTSQILIITSLDFKTKLTIPQNNLFTTWHQQDRTLQSLSQGSKVRLYADSFPKGEINICAFGGSTACVISRIAILNVCNATAALKYFFVIIKIIIYICAGVGSTATVIIRIANHILTKPRAFCGGLKGKRSS
jgi:hypothetical protein